MFRFQKEAKVAEAAFPMIHDVDHRVAVVSPEACVSTHAVIGAPGEWRNKPTRFPALIDVGVIVREFARVQAGCDRATIIGAHTLLMAGSHVGHDAHVGANCEVAPNAVIGGCCTLGDRIKVGMGAVVNPFVTIGDGARIGSGAVVTKDVPAGETWVGSPARRIGPKFEVGS